MRHLVFLPLLGVVLLAPARAQSCIYSYSSDPRVTNSNGGARNAPLGQTDIVSPPLPSRFSQFLVSRLRFQNAPVLITGLAFSMTHDGSMTYQSIRIRMAHTTTDALSSTFISNQATPPQVVLDTHDYIWPHLVNQWSEIGLQVPFLYVPTAGNLLVEVRVSGVISSNAQPQTLQSGAVTFGGATSFWQDLMVYSEYQGADPAIAARSVVLAPTVRICTDSANLQWLGRGCPGSAGTRPGLGFSGSAQIGLTTNVMLSNALPTHFSILAFAWSFGQPFPLNLASVGMPGCWQYFNPDLTVGLVTNGLGIGSHPLSIPSQPALSNLVLFTQYYVSDQAANAAGVVTTNLGRMVVGF